MIARLEGMTDVKLVQDIKGWAAQEADYFRPLSGGLDPSAKCFSLGHRRAWMGNQADALKGGKGKALLHARPFVGRRRHVMRGDLGRILRD